MKKDSFLKGTIIASLAIIITKILGVLYVIPFYKIIGENGGVLYSYAYNIYNLFLNISTAGIPIAISMIISEYLTLGKLEAKQRVYSLGKKVILTFSIVAFLILFIFSDYFALFFVNGIEGANPISDISLVIKAISISLIITPFLSVLRGYLQGHKFISPGSISQVWEQIIRIIVVLLGSYLAINIFNTSIPTGVSVALTGAFFGAVAAYIYLRVKINKNKKLFETYKDNKKDKIKNKEIINKILMYCVPLVIISITNDLYNIIDMKLIIKGLYIIGVNADTCELISSIVATWAPKICMIIMAISMGLITSLIPHIIEKYTKKDYKGSNEIFNQAISTMLIIALPMVTGIIILSDEVYTIFYGVSPYGPNILVFSAIVSLIVGTLSVMNTALQGFKKFKLVIISTIIGLLINTILDIPIILLLDKLGLIPYIGTMIATIIGSSVSIIIILTYLRKHFNFKYMDILHNLSKTFIPLLAMCIVLLPINYVIPNTTNTLLLLIKVLAFAITGASIYLVILYKNKGLYDTFGKDQTDSILKKLHIKKSQNWDFFNTYTN